jgi:hypothetical protein
MEFDGSAFEVEFSHQDGTSYAMETIPATKLMLLHYELLESVGAVRRCILPRTNNVDKPPPTQRITPIKHRRPTVKFN